MMIEQAKFSIATVATIIVTAFSIVFWMDNRYARADDLQLVVRQIADVRIQQLEDKIFELELIPEFKRTDVQKALLSHYLQVLHDAQKEQSANINNSKANRK